MALRIRAGDPDNAPTGPAFYADIKSGLIWSHSYLFDANFEVLRLTLGATGGVGGAGDGAGDTNANFPLSFR